MFVNVLDSMVEYNLTGDRKSLMKKAKIELNIKKHKGLGHVGKA